jgi:hypothetical protein
MIILPACKFSNKKKEIKQDLLLCAYIEKQIKWHQYHSGRNWVEDRLVDVMTEPCICTKMGNSNDVLLQISTAYVIPEEIYEIKNLTHFSLVGFYGKVPEWDKFTNFGFKYLKFDQFHSIDKSRNIYLYGKKFSNLEELVIYNTDTITLSKEVNFVELRLSGFRSYIKLKGRIFKNTKKIHISVHKYCIDDIDLTCFPKLQELEISVSNLCSADSLYIRHTFLEAMKKNSSIKKLRYNDIILKK